MKGTALALTKVCLVTAVATLLPGCQGILSGVYDEPPAEIHTTSAGRLYIDASDWGEWHYIDLHVLADKADDPGFNTSSAWHTFSIPMPDAGTAGTTPSAGQTGIYTYWYDVFGAGISNHEFRSFAATERQAEPANWTFAVHRNNVRTNGGGAYETSFTSIAQLPEDPGWLGDLEYQPDRWNQTDVWAVQDKMLSGLIGNQGIYVNDVLGNWLGIVIPPMPPSFALNNHVFILKLSDGTFAALQLADYVSATGTKCCLTINYKYPL